MRDKQLLQRPVVVTSAKAIVRRPKIKTEIGANGMGPRAEELIGNTLRYSRIELVLLWTVVFMMVVKLGT